ncbi:MAG: nitrile hydratase subunit beta [Rubrobacter sp.]|jgi:nitrile hydratase|nr:nitrile hydratase subunit beta [Rubrobacter sp.]
MGREVSFSDGETVRVLDLDKSGHVRAPRYVRGKTGTVSHLLGKFKNPEDLAYGKYDGPEKELYRVAFRQSDLWQGYEGNLDDTLVIDIYEHWLEGA